MVINRGAYLVLGRLLESASGRNYYELLEERILIPQHLDQVHPANQSVLPNITPGYMGGASNLKKDGRMKIVKPETFEQMLDDGWHDANTPDYHYGLGLFVFDSGESFGHGGLWPGYRTRVMHYEESGTTIAVQTNRDGNLDMQALVARIGILVPSM